MSINEQAILFCAPLGRVLVARLEGTEALNALPRFVVHVVGEDPEVDLDQVERARAELILRSGDGDHESGARRLDLMVEHVAYLGSGRDGHRFRLDLTHRASLLLLRSDYRVFQKMSTRDIVEKVLGEVGIQHQFRLGARYSERRYCVQYGESYWGFLTRLLAEDGINYWFEVDESGQGVMVLGDWWISHDAAFGGDAFLFDDGAGDRPVNSFHSLERTETLAHDRAQVRDYDVRQPDVFVEGTSGDGPLEYFEYPALVPHNEAATARAQVRLEQLCSGTVQLIGETACVRLVSGRRLFLEGASDEDLTGESLIVGLEHRVTQAGQGAGQASAYVCRATLVPVREDRMFRPAIPTSAPRVPGLETGTTTGPAGEEIHVDDLGCVKLRFPWDRSGVADETSSRWVRTLQMPMQESMILPRVGWEVPVAYLDGNPDAPVVLGRVYNGALPMPYSLPAKKAVSSWQSSAYPGAGSAQEIRFTDDKGSMETFVHAPHNQTVYVGGSALTAVGAKEVSQIGKSSVTEILGSQTIVVGGSQHVNVATGVDVLSKGARTESIGGTEHLGVKANRIVSCASYSEVVGGLYSLLCNQANTTVHGAFAKSIGGVCSWTAGLGTNQSVAGLRTELVCGARDISGINVGDTTYGRKGIVAGAAQMTAGAELVVNSTRLSVDAASASMTAGGAFVVEGTTITINVSGSIQIKGGSTLSLGGSASHSGGKVKVAASTVEKRSGGKVGD